ncbi:nucleotidyltransferase-like protein [Calidifontibacillus erzurumensis]|uniref:nucleotidyltransferase-like protein n=1 Tax=Calidifontibacillus erzurumensis TaxID=2741433 RepID=UPI0035B5051F
MDERLRPILEENAADENTLGILLYENEKKNWLGSEQPDVNLIVLMRELEFDKNPYMIDHYIVDQLKITVHTVSEQQLCRHLKYSNYLQWILNGQVLFEKENSIQKLRIKLQEIPINIRKKKICIEFANLIKCYSMGKEFYERKQYLDAFTLMVQALQHLATLSVLEHGLYPANSLWNQVKKLEPEVYTFYLELSESNEPIEKRVQLLFLELGFATSSRTRIGSSYLLEIMKSKDEWTLKDLVNDERLIEFAPNLELFLQYLALKNIVAVDDQNSKGSAVYQRKYKVR